MDEKTVEAIRAAINDEVKIMREDLGADDLITEWRKGRILGLMRALLIAHAITPAQYDIYFDKFA